MNHYFLPSRVAGVSWIDQVWHGVSYKGLRHGFGQHRVVEPGNNQMKQFITGEGLGGQCLAQSIQLGMRYLHQFKQSLR